MGGWWDRLRPRLRPAASAQALTRYVEARSGPVDGAPVDAFVSAVIGFYRDTPVAGIVADEGADMLLFQFGLYDWGDGRAFELDVTRQFAHDHEGALSQLHATSRFALDPALEALGAFEAWCERRSDADRFAREVLASPAIAAVRTLRPLRREIRWEMV